MDELSDKEASMGDVDQAAESRIMVSIFLRHDQSKTLGEIGKHLEQTGFWDRFPPEGTDIVSWYVMMGIGQVVTLRFAPERLRELNLALEQCAWGAFRTEFFPTYDFTPVFEMKRKEAREKTGGAKT
jgi:hypothetical protein